MFLPGLAKIVGWRVNQLSRRGLLERASRLAARYVSIQPADQTAWWLYGETLLKLMDYSGAESASREGLERHPSDPALQYLLAVALIGQEGLDDARQVLAQATTESPDSFLPFLGLTRLAAVSRQRSEVLRAAREAERRMVRDDGWARFELAVELMPLPEADELTRQLLSEAIEKLPHSSSRRALSLLYLGLLLEEITPKEAAALEESARRTWRSHVDFEQHLDKMRQNLRSIRSRSRDAARGKKTEPA